MKKTINSRTKGQAGERELCSLLGEAFGVEDVSRNIDQARDGGADIVCIPPLAIEVKRQQNLSSMNSWLDQSIRQITSKNPVPVVAYRQNHQPWRFKVPFVFIGKGKLTKGGARHLIKENFVEMNKDLFVLVAKRLISLHKKSE